MGFFLFIRQIIFWTLSMEIHFDVQSIVDFHLSYLFVLDSLP